MDEEEASAGRRSAPVPAAAIVEEQHCRPVLLLIVPCERELEVSRDARFVKGAAVLQQTSRAGRRSDSSQAIPSRYSCSPAAWRAVSRRAKSFIRITRPRRKVKSERRGSSIGIPLPVPRPR
jgi:hypothetical protein